MGSSSLTSRAGPGQAWPSDPALQVLRSIEAELDSLHRRHQQELDRLSSDADPDGSAAAEEAERHAVRQELQGQIREAERELESVRVSAQVDGACTLVFGTHNSDMLCLLNAFPRNLQRQHESMRDPTPAEMQASYDLLQSHEQQVAMLQQALSACDELSRGNLRRARTAASGAELQVRYCDDAAELLKRAADASRNAIAELESALRSAGDEVEAGPLRQRLQDMQGMAEDITRRQGDVAAELRAGQARRGQLSEQLTSEELATRLREEWLQQARKAAAAAVTATAWERRLAAVSVHLLCGRGMASCVRRFSPVALMTHSMCRFSHLTGPARYGAARDASGTPAGQDQGLQFPGADDEGSGGAAPQAGR